MSKPSGTKVKSVPLMCRLLQRGPVVSMPPTSTGYTGCGLAAESLTFTPTAERPDIALLKTTSSTSVGAL